VVDDGVVHIELFELFRGRGNMTKPHSAYLMDQARVLASLEKIADLPGAPPGARSEVALLGSKLLYAVLAVLAESNMRPVTDVSATGEAAAEAAKAMDMLADLLPSVTESVEVAKLHAEMKQLFEQAAKSRPTDN